MTNCFKCVGRALAIKEEYEKVSMGAGKKFNNSWLFLGVLGLSFIYFLFNTNVFMDDVFIYLRVVRNIAGGLGPVLNPGDMHFAVTSPLWVFLLGGLHKLFFSIDLILLSKIVFLLILSGSSYFVFLLMRRYIGTWAVLVPIPLFFNYITLTTIGGEIALVYLGIFGILWAYYEKKNFILTGVFGGIAYLSRAELVLIFVILAIHYIMTWKKEKRNFEEMLVNVKQFSIPFLSIVLIWHFYYFIQFHALFPNTLKTKIIQGESGKWELYWRFSRFHTLAGLSNKFYLAFFLLFGIGYYRTISLSIAGYTFLHYYAYKLLNVPDYHWYYYDFYILTSLFTVFGIIAFFVFIGRLITECRQGDKPFGFHLLRKILGIVLILCFACTGIYYTTKINTMKSYKNDNRYNEYKKVSDIINSKLQKGDAILAPEIGIISYMVKDSIIRDICGIASTDVTVKNINDLNYFVNKYLPRFVFINYGVHRENDHLYYMVNSRISDYIRIFDGIQVGENYRGSVFMYRGGISTSEDLQLLEEARKNALFAAKMEYIKISQGFGLSIQPPFSAQIHVPGNAKQFSLYFGFLPRYLSNPLCKQAMFRVYGSKSNIKVLIFKKLVEPFNTIKDREEQYLSISFPKGKYDRLEIDICDEKTPGNACTYLRFPKFIN